MTKNIKLSEIIDRMLKEQYITEPVDKEVVAVALSVCERIILGGLVEGQDVVKD